MASNSLAIWEAERKPWTFVGGGEESGLWRSRDGGDSWEELTEGLPEGIKGRIGVSVSGADPDRVVEALSDLGIATKAADRRNLARDLDRLRMRYYGLELEKIRARSFVEDLMGAYFQINNPNASSSCGCGSSFSL